MFLDLMADGLKMAEFQRFAILEKDEVLQLISDSVPKSTISSVDSSDFMYYYHACATYTWQLKLKCLVLHSHSKSIEIKMLSCYAC